MNMLHFLKNVLEYIILHATVFLKWTCMSDISHTARDSFCWSRVSVPEVNRADNIRMLYGVG